MMEIYCDESRPEAIFGNRDKLTDSNKYMLISGIWIDKNERENIKNNIRTIKNQYDTHGEIKWKNVSPSRLDFYKSLIEYFFESSMRFRCLLIDGSRFNSNLYHNNDDELGFYKFYYQLIYHWIEPFTGYNIFLDYKKNKMPDRLQSLQRVLNNSQFSNIEIVQALPSNESVLIQMSDLLMGAVNYKFHNYYTSPAKRELVELIESKLPYRTIQATAKTEEKFNVFYLSLR